MNQEDLLTGVADPLRSNLLARGFVELTGVQRAVQESALEGVDLRLTSETGSGKTVALGMVLAHGWRAAGAAAGPDAVVITPTRELANQVRDELSWLLRGLPDATVTVVTGGTNILTERRQLARRPRVVVGTPGRLHDHLRSGALDCSSVKQVVLDEADQMLDMGFRDDLEAILATTPPTRRTHLVSATFPAPVAALAARYQSNVCHLQGTQLGQANADIQHLVHLVSPQQRVAALINLLLLHNDARTLVFVRTRGDTATLAEQLSREGFSVLPLSGDLAQAQRTRTLSAFRSGAISVVVATDVAARGLDVPSIGTVVHFDPPMGPDVYTHRSGRTGRAGATGRSILLIPPAAQYRVRHLLRAAQVEAQFTPPPSASQVLKTARKNFRRTLHERLAGSDASWIQHREYAEKLLADQDPVKLVATLLAESSSKLVTTPREIAGVDTWDERKAHHQASPLRGGRLYKKPPQQVPGAPGHPARPSREVPGQGAPHHRRFGRRHTAGRGSAR